MNWENSQVLITSGRQLLTIIKTLEFQAEVVPLNLLDQALVGLQQDLLRVSRSVTQTWTATELNTIWPIGEWDIWWNRMSSTLLQLLDLLAIWRRQQKLIAAMTFDCQKCLLHSLASTSGLQHLLQAPVDWSRWNTEELPLLRTILSLRGAHILDEPDNRQGMVGLPPPVPLFNAPQGQVLQQPLSFSTPPRSQQTPLTIEQLPRPTPSPGCTQTQQGLHQPWIRNNEPQGRDRGDPQYSMGSPSQANSQPSLPADPTLQQLGTQIGQTALHLSRPPPLPPKPANQPSTPPSQARSHQIPPLMSSAPRFFREIQMHQDGKQQQQEKTSSGGHRQDPKEVKAKHPQEPTAKPHRDRPVQPPTTSGNI